MELQFNETPHEEQKEFKEHIHSLQIYISDFYISMTTVIEFQIFKS